MRFIPFACIWDCEVALQNLGQNVPNECKSSCHDVAWNHFATNVPLDPKLLFWCFSYHFVAFGTIWLPYETRCKTGRTSAKVCATKSRWNFFATNAPNPPHWTLNSCFVAFRTIWVHLGPFGCLTKLGAKRAELVQKFVPRSCIGIFRNKHTRSTPLDPKLMFCGVSYHLGAFRTVWLPYETRCKIGRSRAKVRATKSHRKFSR